MFNYCGDNNAIKSAILIIKKGAFQNALYEKIIAADQFTYTKLSNKAIAIKLLNTLSSADICIKVYYPKWRWSKSLGYYSPSEPNQININGYRIKNLSIGDLVGLICHETIHLSDINGEYGHGSNKRTPDKENSAPYFVGNTSKKTVRERTL